MMLLRKSILLIVLTLIFSASYSQQKCKCCDEVHSQFDFWLGEWNVYDTTGKLVGENTIIKIEGNCVLSEHWIGKSGFTGRSFNYYDKTDSTWNQLWIDNQGNNLNLKGKAGQNKMVLRSELIKDKKVDFYRNRIAWLKNEDGSVSQIWDVLDKEGNILQNLFTGIYKNKRNEN